MNIPIHSDGELNEGQYLWISMILFDFFDQMDMEDKMRATEVLDCINEKIFEIIAREDSFMERFRRSWDRTEGISEN